MIRCIFFLFALLMSVGGTITMIMSEGEMWLPATAFFVIAFLSIVLGTRYRSPDRIVEREVVVTRRIPARCVKCGADISSRDVEWVGPDSARCPHCGATLSVRTERL